MRSLWTQAAKAERPGCAATGIKRWLKLGAMATFLTALPGCQNMTAGMPAAQVRIIDTSADAPELDIYEGGSVLAYNLGFGTVSSYVSIPPGGTAVSAHQAGMKSQLTTLRGSFAASGHYTVLLSSVTGALSETVLADQSIPAPAGLASVRVLEQSRRGAGGVDVYLVRSGSTLAGVQPIAANAAPGGGGEYVNVPAGSYRVVVLAAGTVPSGSAVPIYSGATVEFGSGSARTLILLDGQESEERRMQMITAEDYDPGAVAE